MEWHPTDVDNTSIASWFIDAFWSRETNIGKDSTLFLMHTSGFESCSFSNIASEVELLTDTFGLEDCEFNIVSSVVDVAVTFASSVIEFTNVSSVLEFTIFSSVLELIIFSSMCEFTLTGCFLQYLNSLKAQSLNPFHMGRIVILMNWWLNLYTSYVSFFIPFFTLSD